MVRKKEKKTNMNASEKAFVTAAVVVLAMTGGYIASEFFTGDEVVSEEYEYNLYVLDYYEQDGVNYTKYQKDTYYPIEGCNPRDGGSCVEESTLIYWLVESSNYTIVTNDSTVCYTDNGPDEPRVCKHPVHVTLYESIDLKPNEVRALFSDGERTADIKQMDGSKILGPVRLDPGDYDFYIQMESEHGEEAKWNLSIFGGIIDPDISACQTLSAGGVYSLTTDITDESSASPCFVVSSNDVTVDCNGNTIDGNGVVDRAFDVDDVENFTLRNCVITDWDTYAVDLNDVNKSLIDNVNFTSNNDGVLNFYDVDNTNVTNSNLSGGDSFGDWLIRGAYTKNLTVEDSYLSCEYEYSNAVYFYYNYYSDTYFTNVNYTGGCYQTFTVWDDFVPIEANYTFTNFTYADGRYFYILDYQDTSYPDIINESFWPNAGAIIVVEPTSNKTFENFVFNNSGTEFYNDGIAIGYQGQNITFRNITFDGYKYSSNAMFDEGTTEIVFDNIKDYDTQWGHWLEGDSVFKNSVFDNTSESWFGGDSFNFRSLVYNNSFHTTQTGSVYITYSQSGNEQITFFNNFFNMSVYQSGFTAGYYELFNTTLQAGSRVNHPTKSGEYPSFIGGNYYTNSSGDGPSDTCADTDFDGFCDSSISVPDTTYGAVDYLAYSDEYIPNYAPTYDSVSNVSSGNVLNMSVRWEDTDYFNFSSGYIILQWHNGSDWIEFISSDELESGVQNNKVEGGSSGDDIVVDGTTLTLTSANNTQEFGDISVINGGVLYIGDDTTNVVRINASSLTVDSSSVINGSGLGGAGGNPNTAGTGSCPGGAGNINANDAGGGGGYGGAGSDAPDATSASTTCGSSSTDAILTGSGGGAGSDAGDGYGGDGGAGVYMHITDVNISGDIDFNGASGTNAATRAGGGGSGGGVLIKADTVDISGTISANGGDGGNQGACNDCGGGGGGGRIKIFYDTSYSLTGSLSVLGGGSENSAYDGDAGTTYNLETSFTPSVTAGSSVDVNNTAVLYSDVSSYGSDTLTNITFNVNVTGYLPYGSDNNSNTRPELFLSVYNGSDFEELGNFSVSGVGEYSLFTVDSDILSSWTTITNRDFKLQAKYLDFNSSSIYDELNWTNVTVDFDMINYWKNETWNLSDPPGEASGMCDSATGVCWGNFSRVFNNTVNATIEWLQYGIDAGGLVNISSLVSWNVSDDSGTPDFNCSFGSGITKAQYRLLTWGDFPQIVNITGQTDSNPFMICTNNGTASGTLQMRLTAEYGGATPVYDYCDNKTVPTTVITTSFVDVVNLSNGESSDIFCRRNYTALPASKGNLFSYVFNIY